MERLQNVNTAQRAEGIGCPLHATHLALGAPGGRLCPLPQDCLGQSCLSCTLLQPANRGTNQSCFSAPSSVDRLTLPMGGSLRTPLPCLAASQLWSPRREMLIPCCALPSSSPKGKTPLRSGARHGILLSPRAPGLSQGWAGREERSHHVQLPARPPRPAQPPPARPAEPARLARAGGSRPPPRYNGRRRFRRISFPFPRI